MMWDDLRYVLALAKAGSLARAAKDLGVDHTTVGRRVEAAETSLGVRLFTRTPTGVVATADADRLLEPIRRVEDAVLAVERSAEAQDERLAGSIRVTAPETFGAMYLGPRLATFGRSHPGLVIELVASGEVLDLGRRQAEIAVRIFRSRQAGLVARRAGAVAYALYASATYLARRPLRAREALPDHALLGSPEAGAIETRWLARLHPKAVTSFRSTSTLALLAAARAGAGIAVLPRYLGDAEPTLVRVPMPDEPVEALWLTIHGDLRHTPRVRVLVDYLAAAMKRDAGLLSGG